MGIITLKATKLYCIILNIASYDTKYLDCDTTKCFCVNANIAVTNHLCLVNILNVASAVKQLTFKFYLILINLNLIRHMWLMATILDCAGTRFFKKNKIKVIHLQISKYLTKYFTKSRNRAIVFLVVHMGLGLKNCLIWIASMTMTSTTL